MKRRSALWLVPATLLAVASLSARAQQDAETLDRIEVSGHRVPLTHLPGAVTVIDGGALRDGQRQVSLAETLQAVPGVLALERHNHAQDLQLQSRGFGARSTFGIRGIVLVTDGIPASALDGQGQASGFALSMLDRIDVLRGPLALQHGNAAGGALIGSSEPGEAASPRLQGWLGSHGSRRFVVRGDAGAGEWRGRAGLMHFRTNGHRPHSAARRDEAHVIARWAPAPAHEIRFVLDALRQPETDDPLGLTPAQWRAAPDSTDAVALAFDTRKRIDQRQAGLHWRWQHDAYSETRMAAWHSRRDIEQFLAIPVAVQQAPGHPGGVIDLARRSHGVSLSHLRSDGRVNWAAGIDLGRLDEARRGFENHAGGRLGVRGRLRRDESNRVDSRDVWLSGEARFNDAWSGLASARHGRLRLASRDHYLAPGNGDDSGGTVYREDAFAAGLARRIDAGEFFASVGSGYETPTVTELAYRPDGSGGFNFALSPARFNSIEAGMRWRTDDLEGSLAAYRIDGRGEIVQVQSSSGRSAFATPPAPAATVSKAACARPSTPISTSARCCNGSMHATPRAGLAGSCEAVLPNCARSAPAAASPASRAAPGISRSTGTGPIAASRWPGRPPAMPRSRSTIPAAPRPRATCGTRSHCAGGIRTLPVGMPLPESTICSTGATWAR